MLYKLRVISILFHTEKHKKIIDEASSLDRINMTKNRLEFDQKNFTPKNVNIGT